jgi:hypothetical protein
LTEQFTLLYQALSDSLRIGFAARRRIPPTNAPSQFTIRLVYRMLAIVAAANDLSSLHERLGEAGLNVICAFERSGLKLLV